MTRAQAQRLRFGILAARHEGERRRMNWDQLEYMDGCALAGWRKRDSRAAYNEEWKAINARRRHDGIRRPGEIASRRRNRRRILLGS